MHSIFIGALFIITKLWKQPKMIVEGEGVHTHTWNITQPGKETQWTITQA